MFHISLLILVIGYCIFTFILFKAWIVGYDFYSAAAVDQKWYSELVNEISNTTDMSKLKELELRVQEYLAFRESHKEEIEIGDSVSAYMDDPAANYVSQYISHSVSGRIFIISMVNFYGYIENVLAFYMASQLGSTVQSFIDNLDTSIMRSNQLTALIITFIGTMFFMLSKTVVTNWASRQLGDTGMNPLYNTNNMKVLNAMKQQQQPR